MSTRAERRRRRRWERWHGVKGTVLLPKVKADPNVLPPSAAITVPYCWEDGCTKQATTSRPVGMAGETPVVELVCDDHGPEGD